ncbi:flavodoxin family protein [Chloroflexota bacterium]
MKILVACYSETGNTEKVGAAVQDEVASQGHEAHLKAIGDITDAALSAYDVVFLGSACHDADLAKPVKEFLGRIPLSPAFKLAGFATHASYTPGGSDREQEVYDTWASRCPHSFRQAGQEKGIDLLGYFGCQGAPSPPIEQFIRNTIVIDEQEWQEYAREVRKHPDKEDLRRARQFAQQVLAKC